MNRLFKILICACIVTMTIACTNTKNKTTGQNDGLPETATNTWFVNSLDEIETYESSEVSNRIELNMLRNETEHVQLVISTANDDVLEIERTGSENEITFDCRRIAVYEKMNDVLVPCNGKIKPEDNLVKVWLTFKTNTDTKPGEYKEIIKFKRIDAEYTVAVTLNVADAAIPEIPTIPSVFGINPANLILKGLDGEQKMAKRKELADLLLEYRISPYFCTWIDGSMQTECFSSPYSWNDFRSWEYLKDSRFNRIALPYYDLKESELKVMLDKARKEGLLDKAYFYIWDEPTTMAEYEKIHKMADIIHKYAPEAKILTSFFRGPKDGEYKEDLFAVFDILDGATSIYCTGVWSLKKDEERSAMCRSKIKDGQEWWCYVCMDDVPGLAQNSCGIPNRIVMWRHWKEQSKGFLYWVANSFDGMDPIKSQSFLPEGDGTMLYPGEPYGSDVPCVSKRLEIWRDGAEDYEMLKMYEEKYGREATETVLEKVYTSPTEYTDNANLINEMKHTLIEGLIK